VLQAPAGGRQHPGPNGEHVGAGPGGVVHQGVAPTHGAPVHLGAGEGHGGAGAGLGPLNGGAVVLDPPDPGLPAFGKQTDGVRDTQRSGPEGAGDHGARPLHREAPVHRQAQEVIHATAPPPASRREQGVPEDLQPRPVLGRGGHHRRRLPRGAPQRLAELVLHQLQPGRLHKVRLGEGHHHLGDPQELHHRQVLPGLGHDALVGGHGQEDHVHARGPGHHGAHEVLVSRNVHHPEHQLVAVPQLGEAQVDGDPPLLLLLEAVGIHAGEGVHQRRLAVVDVPGRAQDGSEGTAHAASSSAGRSSPRKRRDLRGRAAMW